LNYILKCYFSYYCFFIFYFGLDKSNRGWIAPLGKLFEIFIQFFLIITFNIFTLLNKSDYVRDLIFYVMLYFYIDTPAASLDILLRLIYHLFELKCWKYCFFFGKFLYFISSMVFRLIFIKKWFFSLFLNQKLLQIPPNIFIHLIRSDI